MHPVDYVVDGNIWRAALCADASFNAQGSFANISWPGLGIGVSYAPILGIALAIAALVIKALLTDIEISKLKTREQRLIQKVALLES